MSDKKSLANDIFGSDSLLEKSEAGDCPFTDSSDTLPSEEEEEAAEPASGSDDSSEHDIEEDEDLPNIHEESDEEIPPSPTFNKAPARPFVKSLVNQISQEVPEENLINESPLRQAVRAGLKTCDDIKSCHRTEECPRQKILS